MERKWIAGLASVFSAGLLLTAAGCGGSGESKVSAPATSTSAHATKAATTDTKVAATRAKAAPSGAKTTAKTTTSAHTTTATTTPKVPALAVTDCRELASLARRMGQAFNGHQPAADAKAYADFLHQLADRGPAEFRGDFAVMAEAYGKIADALAAVYTSPTVQPTDEQKAQLADVGKALNTG